MKKTEETGKRMRYDMIPPRGENPIPALDLAGPEAPPSVRPARLSGRIITMIWASTPPGPPVLRLMSLFPKWNRPPLCANRAASVKVVGANFKTSLKFRKKKKVRCNSQVNEKGFGLRLWKKLKSNT